MAKNRPTQRLRMGAIEGYIFSERRGKYQRFLFNTIVPKKDVSEAQAMLEEISKERGLGLTTKANYCLMIEEGSFTSLEEVANEVLPRVGPGEYFIICSTKNGETKEKALFKNVGDKPKRCGLDKAVDREFEKLINSIPRGHTRFINNEETQNYETAPSFTEQGFPSVSQEILQPVNDTEIPVTRKDKIPNLERQVDTEIPTKKAPEIQPLPQSQRDFSPQEIAAAELGIPPETALQPSSTSQFFKDDIQKKSSDTLMPEETDYSTDKTERDLPALSPSNTTINFKNDTPVPTSADSDDLQFSDEEFDLSDDDSEAILDLDGELGNTRHLTRTPTGKLVTPDGEKLIDASAPSLKPVSSDTEMVPALKNQDNLSKDAIRAHLDSLDKIPKTDLSVEDNYFGKPGDDSDEVFTPPRSLTKEVEIPKPLSNNLRKDDIPFNQESKVLGKDDIKPIESSKDVGDDTELNMPAVTDKDFVPGSKTERLPPVPSIKSSTEDGVEDMYVLDTPVKEGRADKPVEKVVAEMPEKSHAKAMRIIGKLKDAGWDFDEHGRAALKTKLTQGEKGLVLSKELLDALVKGNVSQNDLILVPRIKMQGDSSGLYDRILQIEGNPDEDLRKNMLKIYDEQVKHNSELSDSEKRLFYESFVGREPKSKISWFKSGAIAAGIAAAFIGGYFFDSGNSPANNSDLEGKLAQVTTERDSANSKHDKLSKEYQIIVSSEKDLKSQLESAKKEKSALEESMKSAVSKEEFDSLSKQYESLKLEEQKIKEQIESLNKEKSSLESLLESEKKIRESQKSEYESQLSAKDALIDELEEKYSSYVPRETIDDLVKENEQNKARIDALKGELDSLKGEVEKYRALGKYEDVKDLVDKKNSQQRIAVNSEKVYETYLGQLERHEVTNDELYRHIICARLTKAMIRSGVELQVWTDFMRLVDRHESNDFGSTKEQSALVAATLMGAVAADVESGKGAFDNSTIDKIVSKYKSLRGAKSDSKSYDRKCLSAAELAEQHFLKQ